MSNSFDLNFLRFLTLEIPQSVFENYLIRGLHKNLTIQKIKNYISDYLRDDRSYWLKKGFNLYLHIPYCADNCTYCHCTHRQISCLKELDDYCDFIYRQIKLFSPLFSSVSMSSLYFGGGTPSLLSADNITQLFERLRQNFAFKESMQINFEAHPSTLTQDKMVILKRYNVNRISLGVQSLDPKVLNAIGRLQNEAMVLRCVEGIKKNGFKHFNIDLVAGLPEQTVTSFLSDLKKIINLKPDVLHVTPFSDIFSTQYYKKHKCDISEFIKRRHEMIIEAKAILKAGGYHRYGFEAYQRRPGGENYQQLSYLNNFANILGLGHNTQSMFFDKIIFRNMDKKGLNECFYGCSINKRYVMAGYLGFHLLKGFKHSQFQKVFGESVLSVFKREMDFLVKSGMISVSRERLLYAGPWTMDGLFEYFSATKIFYGKDLLSKLHKKYRGKYSIKKTYSLKKSFFNVIEDNWIAGLYYDGGL